MASSSSMLLPSPAKGAIATLMPSRRDRGTGPERVRLVVVMAIFIVMYAVSVLVRHAYHINSGAIVDTDVGGTSRPGTTAVPKMSSFSQTGEGTGNESQMQVSKLSDMSPSSSTSTSQPNAPSSTDVLGAPEAGASIFAAGIVHMQGNATMVNFRTVTGKQRHEPVFVHIPQNLGFEVESALHSSLHVDLGMNAFEKLKTAGNDANVAGVYKTIPQKFPYCSQWKLPPSEFVPESFAIVQNPYTRVASEMCDSMMVMNKAWIKQHAGYAQGQGSLADVVKRVFGPSFSMGALRREDSRSGVCKVLKAWLVPSLEKAVAQMERGGSGVEDYLHTGHDCHLLPQAAYLKNVEWAIDTGSVHEMVRELLRGYGREGYKVNCVKNSAPPICKQRVVDCFDDEIATLIEKFEKATFDYFAFSKDWRALQTKRDAIAGSSPDASAASNTATGARIFSDGIVQIQGDTRPASSDANGIVNTATGSSSLLANRKREYPVLIHSPKTGGTTVENAFKANYDIHVGMYAFEGKGLGKNAAGVYDHVPQQCARCVNWHMPPARFVPESFVIVRNPYTRVSSEFCFDIMKLNSYPRLSSLKYVYQDVFKHHDVPQTKFLDDRNDEDAKRKMCTVFYRWMVPKLQDASTRTRLSHAFASTVDTSIDCHLTPQVAFWRHAEWAIELGKLSSLSTLMQGYGYADFDLKKTETTHAEVSKNSEMASPPGCGSAILDCFDDRIAELVEALDAATFEYFGYEKDYRKLQSKNASKR